MHCNEDVPASFDLQLRQRGSSRFGIHCVNCSPKIELGNGDVFHIISNTQQVPDQLRITTAVLRLSRLIAVVRLTVRTHRGGLVKKDRPQSRSNVVTSDHLEGMVDDRRADSSIFAFSTTDNWFVTTYTHKDRRRRSRWPTCASHRDTTSRHAQFHNSIPYSLDTLVR